MSVWGDPASMRSTRRRLSRSGEDEVLADRLRRGDVDAMAQLFDLHAPATLAVALTVTPDQAAAEAAVHDAFVTVWRQIATFDSRTGSLLAWLLVIIRRQASESVREAPAGLPRKELDARSLGTGWR